MENNTVKQKSDYEIFHFMNEFSIYSQQLGGLCKIPFSENKKDISEQQAEKNAKLILKSVNGYSEAIEALKKAKLALMVLLPDNPEQSKVYNEIVEVIKQSEERL